MRQARPGTTHEAEDMGADDAASAPGRDEHAGGGQHDGDDHEDLAVGGDVERRTAVTSGPGEEHDEEHDVDDGADEGS